MEWNKKVAILYSLAALLLLGIGVMGVYLHQAPLVGDTPLRLHVIANSDSPYDQQVKLIVRDKALEILQAELEHAADKEEAMVNISRELDNLETGCRAVLAEHADYDLYAYLGESSFPTKAYGDMLLSAGDYDALKIVLGEGGGENWWCVLFPPLCFVDLASAREQTVMSTPQGAGSPDQESVEIRLRINELFGKW